jgi:hypothetical protein
MMGQAPELPSLPAKERQTPPVPEILAALKEAARAADSVGFAVARNLIGPREAFRRLEDAHRLRVEAVAKLPQGHRWGKPLQAFIEARGAQLAKLR